MAPFTDKNAPAHSTGRTDRQHPYCSGQATANESTARAAGPVHTQHLSLGEYRVRQDPADLMTGTSRRRILKEHLTTIEMFH